MGLSARLPHPALGFVIALALAGWASPAHVLLPASTSEGVTARAATSTPAAAPQLDDERRQAPVLDRFADLTPLEVEAAQRTAALALAEAFRRGVDPASVSASTDPSRPVLATGAPGTPGPASLLFPGAEAALAGWHRALADDAWPVRRAALLAFARVPIWSVGTPPDAAPYAASLDRIGALLADPHPSVVEAALLVGMRHGCLDRWAATGAADALRALLVEPTPGVRETLARAAGRFPAPVLVASGAPAAAADRSATARLRLELLEGLMADRDPAVRAEARAALLLADLPVVQGGAETGLAAANAAWNERRIELLLGALEGHDGTRAPVPGFDPAVVIAYLELFARGSGDADLSARLVAAAPQLAAALAAETTSSPAIWHGLVQALVVLRGGAPDEAVLTRGFRHWLVVRRSIDLELNSWRYVDQLFEHAIERPSVARGLALIAVGEDEFQSAGVPVGDLYDAFRNGRSPHEVIEIHTLLGGPGLPPEVLSRSVDRGVVAGDLAPLASWEGSDKLSPSWREALERTLFQELARGHLDRPDAATEAELLERLEARTFLARAHFEEPAYDGYAFELYENAFRALCAARTSSGGALRPTDWASAERFFGVLGATYADVWRHSTGVRLDLLTRLPRVPELVAFADLLILVGDTGGVRAAYRADCVELLGACRGVPRVQDALERWFAEEWPDGEGKVVRTDELELAGLVRALAANGAPLGRGEAQAREALELVRARGPLPNLARSALDALARYPGGLAEGARALLAGPVEAGASRAERAGWVEVRADAALRVLAADEAWRADHGDLVAEARGFLMDAVDALESDQVERLCDALAAEDDATSLAFLCAELGERAAQHSVMVGVGPFVDALVERFASGDAARRARVAEVLVATARDAKQMEWRGLAYRGLAEVAAQNAAVPSEQALALLVSVALGPEPEAFAALADEEREFLRDQALFALAGTVRGVDAAARAELVARMARAAEPAVRAISDEHQRERWAGGEPRGGEFATQTAEAVFAALGSTAARRTFLSAGDWHLTDPLFLRRLATIAARGAGADAAGLADELLELAWVAQGGRLVAEEEVAVELLARQLLAARERGDWLAVGLLADELAVRWRRTGIWQRTSSEAFWVGGLLGNYLPKEGREPQARVEAWRYQAATRIAEARGADAAPFASRAAASVGASRAARADL